MRTLQIIIDQRDRRIERDQRADIRHPGLDCNRLLCQQDSLKGRLRSERGRYAHDPEYVARASAVDEQDLGERGRAEGILDLKDELRGGVEAGVEGEIGGELDDRRREGVNAWEEFEAAKVGIGEGHGWG